MLKKIGTMRELTEQAINLPEPAMTDMVTSLVVLDCEYGEERNYYEEGGYNVIAETLEDVLQFKEIVDFDTRPCEWAIKRGNYVSALYLLNDDFGIIVFIPITVAPKAILDEME